MNVDSYEASISITQDDDDWVAECVVHQSINHDGKPMMYGRPSTYIVSGPVLSTVMSIMAQNMRLTVEGLEE